MKSLLLGLCLMLSATLPPSTHADEQPVRHIVVFKYKSDASAEAIAQINDAFSALPEKIPGITSFEMGTNNSPENLNKGFTHVYQLTFTSAQARDSYLPHPEHKKFGELLGSLGILEDVFVVDYAF